MKYTRFTTSEVQKLTALEQHLLDYEVDDGTDGSLTAAVRGTRFTEAHARLEERLGARRDQVSAPEPPPAPANTTGPTQSPMVSLESTFTDSPRLGSIPLPSNIERAPVHISLLSSQHGSIRDALSFVTPPITPDVPKNGGVNRSLELEIGKNRKQLDTETPSGDDVTLRDNALDGSSSLVLDSDGQQNKRIAQDNVSSNKELVEVLEDQVQETGIEVALSQELRDRNPSLSGAVCTEPLSIEELEILQEAKVVVTQSNIFTSGLTISRNGSQSSEDEIMEAMSEGVPEDAPEEVPKQLDTVRGTESTSPEVSESSIVSEAIRGDSTLECMFGGSEEVGEAKSEIQDSNAEPNEDSGLYYVTLYTSNENEDGSTRRTVSLESVANAEAQMESGVGFISEIGDESRTRNTRTGGKEGSVYGEAGTSLDDNRRAPGNRLRGAVEAIIGCLRQKPTVGVRKRM